MTSLLDQFAISPEDKKRLDDLYGTFVEVGKKHLGYQANLLHDYTELNRFFAFTINNIGDPFVDGLYKTNTHAFEREVLAFFADLYHAPQNAYWGYVTNGGTEGNMYALYLAREYLPDAVVYYSQGAHYSVPKTQRFMQFPAVAVATQENGEMDYEALAKEIKKGNRPPIIVATIGTTMHGAIDKVEKIVEVLKRNHITKFYIHCDAALSGMTLPFMLGAPAFDFQLPVDSISVSGHKMIGSPVPCGVVIARKEHVDRIQHDIELTGTPDTTLSGSRNGHSVLFLWYAIRKFGVEGFTQPTQHSLEVRDYVLEQFNQHGLRAHADDFSTVVVIERPPQNLVRKWQLAVEGDTAHLVIMPNVTTEHIDELLADLTGA